MQLYSNLTFVLQKTLLKKKIEWDLFYIKPSICKWNIITVITLKLKKCRINKYLKYSKRLWNEEKLALARLGCPYIIKVLCFKPPNLNPNGEELEEGFYKPINILFLSHSFSSKDIVDYYMIRCVYFHPYDLIQSPTLSNPFLSLPFFTSLGRPQ